MIKAIVCVAKDFGIGKKDGLLFNIPADMAHFKAETLGHVCLFGFSTYMSLRHRPLKDRVNIVLWDKATSLDCLEGAITFSDFDQMLKFVQILAQTEDVFVCGGASIYKAMLPYTQVIDITFVDAVDPEATAFFPNISEMEEWECKVAGPYFRDSGLDCQMLNTNNYLISQQIWRRKDV